MSVVALILLIIFLLGSFFVQAASSAFHALENVQSREQLEGTGSFRLYRAILRPFHPDHELESLFFSISCTKHLFRLSFVVAVTLFLTLPADPTWLWLIVGFILLAFLSLLFCDFLPRIWGTRYPRAALSLSAPPASLSLFSALPITYPILLLTRNHLSSHYLEEVQAPVGQVKEKIMEMIQEADATTQLDKREKELLEGVVGFRDRIVREVMMPRIDIVSLPHTATLREAAALFNEEGYSRIPVYRDTIDTIIGLLMFKDLLHLYHQCDLASDQTLLDQTVESYVKPVIYVPETSRVSNLLHDFRLKKSHLAVVVDEYGGTEGIVTMEDCLEEIVGEIADETDEQEQSLFTLQKDGGWIVDARMSIHDIEEEFDIPIPQEGDYDTIGGYAFHKAGEIPTKGLKIHHDEFDLEILEVTERHVVRVKISPKG